MGALEEKIVALRAEKAKAEGKDAPKEKAADVVLAAVDKRELAEAKAHVHAAVITGPCEFTHESVHISVERVAVRRGALWVRLRANCPTSNPYVFGNPPIQVERGKDDPEAAFREMVGQTVVGWARKQGWRP